MGVARALVKFTYTIIIWYVYIAERAWDAVVAPFTDFLSAYSETVGESFERVLRIAYYALLVSPLFGAATAISIVVFNDAAGVAELTSIETPEVSILVAYTLGCATVLYTFVANYSLDERNSWEHVLVVGLLIGGAIASYTLDPPHVYAVFLATVYGLGAYATSYIDFDVTYTFHHVFSDLEPQEDSAGESWAMTSILIVLAIATWFNPLQLNNAVLIGTVVMTGLSYFLTLRQQHYYDVVYSHLRLDTSSRLWLLPARISVVSGAALIFLDTSLFWPALLAFFMPFFMGFCFNAYFSRTGDRGVWELAWGEHRSNTADEYVENKGEVPFEDVDLDYNVEDFEDSDNDHMADGAIELNLRVEIPKGMPRRHRPWATFLFTATYVKKLISGLACVDESEEAKYEEFYEDAVRIGANQLEKTDQGLKFDNYPDYLVREIDKQRAESGDVTMEDLVDTEFGDVDISNPRNYVDSQSNAQL